MKNKIKCNQTRARLALVTLRQASLIKTSKPPTCTTEAEDSDVECIRTSPELSQSRWASLWMAVSDDPPAWCCPVSNLYGSVQCLSVRLVLWPSASKCVHREVLRMCQSVKTGKFQIVLSIQCPYVFDDGPYSMQWQRGPFCLGHVIIEANI